MTAPSSGWLDWLERVFEFVSGKHTAAVELLEVGEAEPDGYDDDRARILETARPLLAAAQESGTVREDIAIEQVVDLVAVIVHARGPVVHRRQMFAVVVAGLTGREANGGR